MTEGITFSIPALTSPNPETMAEKRQNKSTSSNEKAQRAWAIGIGIGTIASVAGVLNNNYEAVFCGLGVAGINALGYAGYLEQNDPSPVSNSLWKNVVQLCKDDKMYALCTLFCVCLSAYGVANGFATGGNISELKSGLGLLGLCNLVKARCSRDEKISKICNQLGTAFLLGSFLTPSNVLSSPNVIFPARDGMPPLICQTYHPKFLDLFKETIKVIR